MKMMAIEPSALADYETTKKRIADMTASGASRDDIEAAIGRASNRSIATHVAKIAKARASRDDIEAAIGRASISSAVKQIAKIAKVRAGQSEDDEEAEDEETAKKKPAAEPKTKKATTTKKAVKKVKAKPPVDVEVEDEDEDEDEDDDRDDDDHDDDDDDDDGDEEEADKVARSIGFASAAAMRAEHAKAHRKAKAWKAPDLDRLSTERQVAANLGLGPIGSGRMGKLQARAHVKRDAPKPAAKADADLRARGYLR